MIVSPEIAKLLEGVCGRIERMNSCQGMHRAQTELLFRNHAVDGSGEFAWFVHDCYCAYVSGFARTISAKRRHAESLWRVLKELKATPIALDRNAYVAAHGSTDRHSTAEANHARQRIWEDLFPGVDAISKHRLEQDQLALAGICERIRCLTEERLAQHKEAPTKEDLLNWSLDYLLFEIVLLAKPYVTLLLNKDIGGHRPDAEWRRLVEAASEALPPSLD